MSDQEAEYDCVLIYVFQLDPRARVIFFFPSAIHSVVLELNYYSSLCLHLQIYIIGLKKKTEWRAGEEGRRENKKTRAKGQT